MLIDAAGPVLPPLPADPLRPALAVDHMGYPAPGRPLNTLAPIVAAVRDGLVHTKLSAPCRISALPPPHADALDLAQQLPHANPARCLWASDWPHTDTDGGCVADAAWLNSFETLSPDARALLSNTAEKSIGPDPAPATSMRFRRGNFSPAFQTAFSPRHPLKKRSTRP